MASRKTIRFTDEGERDLETLRRALTADMPLRKDLTETDLVMHALRAIAAGLSPKPKRAHRAAPTEFCGDCDGVGSVEGGTALQTTCKTRKGTGKRPPKEPARKAARL
jgi:hypothetical protein